MKLKLQVLCAAMLSSALLVAPVTQAADKSDGELFEIKVAQQPQRWALPWYIATEKGWWDEVGLKPEFTTFSSGAPQIAAGASGSWDVGGAGNIPSVLGAARYGLTTIAIANSEEKIITLMAQKDKADDILNDPSLLKGAVIPVPTNTTGHWGAMVCMEKKFDLDRKDYRLLNLSPPEINAAMSSERFDVAQVWAPNMYLLDNSIGAKQICSGDEVGMNITSNVFVTPKFAEEHPEETAKFLAVYLRGIAYEQAHPEEAEKLLGEFFQSAGVDLPEKYYRIELDNRPDYTLSEQLEKLDGGNDSWLGQSWAAVADFMVSVGAAKTAPVYSENATDKFLKMINDDPDLKVFAEKTD